MVDVTVDDEPPVTLDPVVELWKLTPSEEGPKDSTNPTKAMDRLEAVVVAKPTGVAVALAVVAESRLSVIEFKPRKGPDDAETSPDAAALVLLETDADDETAAEDRDVEGSAATVCAIPVPFELEMNDDESTVNPEDDAVGRAVESATAELRDESTEDLIDEPAATVGTDRVSFELVDEDERAEAKLEGVVDGMEASSEDPGRVIFTLDSSLDNAAVESKVGCDEPESKLVAAPVAVELDSGIDDVVVEPKPDCEEPEGSAVAGPVAFKLDAGVDSATESKDDRVVSVNPVASRPVDELSPNALVFDDGAKLAIDRVVLTPDVADSEDVPKLKSDDEADEAGVSTEDPEDRSSVELNDPPLNAKKFRSVPETEDEVAVEDVIELSVGV